MSASIGAASGSVRTEPAAVPELVAGRFQIGDLIATGGEAQVYVAHDLELDLSVVIKTRQVVDSDDLNRLRREAGMLMRIVPHRGIPMVRSDLVDGDRYYMISDFVAGNDLHSVVAAQSGAGLPLASVLDLIDQVAQTLDHLHGHQPPIVHGDVKSENLILTSDSRLVLVDFGAAMRVGDDRERLGTPGFSAPEVLAGEALTPAADVYSLAALTVFLVTGLVPKLGIGWPTALADAGIVRLERVLRRGLTWDPLGRPWRASEFAARLREAAEMDVPTGTVTLVLVEASGSDTGSSPTTLLNMLEAAGGRNVQAVSLPSRCSLVVFPRAGDAAAAALEAIASGQPPIAVHAGDLGGWHGATLQQLADEAVALRTGAAPATVVCSPPVRMLLGADDTMAFVPVANGLRIERATDTRYSTNRSGSTDSTQRGARHAESWVAARRARPIVGRNAELQRALAAIARGRSEGAAPLVVVVAEAGMGKTRLLAEVAAGSTSEGERLLVGRCTESGGAFEPFLDALGDDLFPFESGQLERDEEGWIDRRRFFGRIADSLAALGGPVTLVIDDMQWIDGSSMALLSQLFDDMAGTLAVVVGSRPSIDRHSYDELTMRPDATVVQLGPLSPADITDMAEAAGLALSAETVAGLHSLTGGSPFFGVQLLSHLRNVPGHTLEGGDLPVGVREWIMQRVAGLGEAAQAMLAPAAVMGRSFEVVRLADVLDVSPLEALTQIDAATSAGLLVDGEHPGEFRFVHAIVRTTLEESLSTSRRALLHAAVAQRLEEAGDDHEQLEEAMHHWFAAERLGDPLHAGEVAVEVATRTTERLAHERAVSILDRALEVLALAPATSARDRVEARLRVAHGRADFVASRNDDGIAQLYRAADLAETGDDPATLAQAALVASLNRRHGLDDPDLLRLLERASDRCPPEPAVLPAMLHIRRARLLPATVRHEQRCAMARLGLVDLDRMEPVDRATVETEVARACWGPDDAEARVALTTRQIDEATAQLQADGSSRWTGVLVEALNHRCAARVQLGQLIDALTDADRAAELADAAGTTFLLTRVMMGQAMINSTLGNHELAERLCNDAVALSDRHNLMLVQMAIGYGIGRDRGQQAELARLEHQFGEFVDQNPLLVAAFALVHAEAGQLDDATRLLGVLQEAAPWPRNWLWLGTTVAALEAAVLTGDADMSRRFAAVLKRYSGQWALAGAELACWGPVDRVLGLAQAAAGQYDEARVLLTSALDVATSQGASPWVTRCRDGLAVLEARPS